MTRRRVVLAGGTGFLGQSLGSHLAAGGWDPIVLTREPSTTPRFPELEWDGRALGPWSNALEGVDAVINLAGRSVNCRFTKENRRRVMDSRVDSTRVLGEAIARCGAPPRVWLNSSTATIYRHTLGSPHDETSTDYVPTPEAKDEYSVRVALAWENAFAEASAPGTRKIALRTTIVFGTVQGGVFRIMRRMARLGLAGPMAGGRQFVSWIHDQDFCRAVEWILAHPELEGPVNVAAPHPVTNREMMKCFRDACGIPLGIPAARWMLEIGAFVMRTETELLLKSRHVAPGKLLRSGFEFKFPTLPEALADLERRVRAANVD
jgi:uncharacterized protein